jgi:hypothetical protein
MENKLNKFLEELIQEIEKELDEATTSGAAGAYSTPNAFSDKGKSDKKRKKKIATTLGYSVVGNDVGNIDEGKYNYKADALTAYFKGKIDAKELDKIARDDFKSGIATKKELSNFLSNKFTQDVMSDTYGIPAGTLIKRVRGLMKFAEGKGDGVPQGYNPMVESKVKRPINRWLAIKNDETKHPHKKMAMGLKELKNQLAETQKFFNWYNKIKTMNELDSNQYWKRTNKHIYKIKERLVNIAKTIQEIEK